MGREDNQPDWDKIAEKFDIWLPQIEPVGTALLEKLAARPGDAILDMGSGTGEPALTLARTLGAQVQITGIDAAEGMVKVAQKKVDTERLPGITFQTMPAEKMSFADNSFDRALCRFGVMLFEDPLQGLKEMRRVLKPQGRFSLAVWSTPETMPTLHWSYQVFKDRVEEAYYPPLARVTSLGEPGTVEALLDAAGFSDYTVEARTFHYNFDSFEDYWDAVEASEILKMQYDQLPDEQRHQIRDEVGRFARDFVQDDRLVIPHDYLLVYGNK
jgi:ubiquinone/menaquinone biosynthesis C-methylase UbiE